MTHYVAWMERSGIRDNLAPLWWHQMAGQCFEYLLPHQSDEKALHDSLCSLDGAKRNPGWLVRCSPRIPLHF
ncbi:MAG: hypothetical protein ABW108_11960, partial [Candidatus Thiodiazotropha sp. 6PLUC10]